MKFMKNNKNFIAIIIVLLLLAVSYKVYKVIDFNNNKIDKEVVNIVLKNNEIGTGISNRIRNYNKNNDDIYINLILTNDDYDNLVHTKLANKSKIDILEYNGKTLIEKDFIQPLDNLNINLSNVEDNSEFLYNNEVIGIKYGSAMPKLMYNNSILKAAGVSSDFIPKNLDDLIWMLEKVKVYEPNIIPLNLSLSSIHDLFSLLGTAATSEASTYPTFWNYKSGKYDYSGLDIVLEKFRYMYEKQLINLDFDSKTMEDLFIEFNDEKSAVMLTNYYQKNSVKNRLADIDIRFSNIPFASEESGTLYYHTYPRILVLANNASDDELVQVKEEEKSKHDLAVKEVFEWLISEETTRYLVEHDNNFASFGNNYMQSNVYDGLNDNKNYKHSLKDPTELLAGNSDIVKDNIFSIIRGEIDIESGINKLDNEMNSYILNNERNKDVELDKYKE